MDNYNDKTLAQIPSGFIDLVVRYPHPVGLPADEWDEILRDAKEEFELACATAAFSSWRVEEKDMLDVGEIADAFLPERARWPWTPA